MLGDCTISSSFSSNSTEVNTKPASATVFKPRDLYSVGVVFSLKDFYFLNNFIRIFLIIQIIFDFNTVILCAAREVLKKE